VLDVLAGRRVLELGREDRQPVQEQPEVERVLGALAVAELPHDGEDVRLVQLSQLGVEAARREEVRELERGAVALDPLAQDVERAAAAHLGSEP
jgi:hypothetical protein